MSHERAQAITDLADEWRSGLGMTVMTDELKRLRALGPVDPIQERLGFVQATLNMLRERAEAERNAQIDQED